MPKIGPSPSFYDPFNSEELNWNKRMVVCKSPIHSDLSTWEPTNRFWSILSQITSLKRAGSSETAVAQMPEAYCKTNIRSKWVVRRASAALQSATAAQHPTEHTILTESHKPRQIGQSNVRRVSVSWRFQNTWAVEHNIQRRISAAQLPMSFQSNSGRSSILRWSLFMINNGQTFKKIGLIISFKE